MKKQSKRVAVIRNEHTKKEMDALDNEYAANKAPYMTLQQALNLAKDSQEQQGRKKVV